MERSRGHRLPEVGNYLIQLVVGWIWQGAFWTMDGILMLLEWAFSLTLITRTPCRSWRPG